MQELLGFAVRHAVIKLRVKVFGQHTFAQPLDASATLSLVFGIKDITVAGCEELLLLQFYALPRWIAQNAIKAASGKHLRKRQRPVQHASLQTNCLRSGKLKGIRSRKLVA